MDTDSPPQAQAYHLAGRARSAARAAFGLCADLIVPPCCLGCHARLMAHHLLCAVCWKDVHFIRQPLCDVMGIPLPFDTGGRTVSAAAVARAPAYDRLRAVAHFSGSMRRLVHQFKYGDRQDARALFGCWLAEAGKDLEDDLDLILPVPMSRLRLFSRRFNHAAVLAQEVARRLAIPARPNVLKRVRATRTQVGLTHDQRRRNVMGAFQVAAARSTRLQGRNVLLIDDVITTGATVEACARTLKRAGAARVDVLALAMVTDAALIAP